jgi:hypothetical protein
MPSALSVPVEIDDLLSREWTRLRGPGTWFGGEERVAIAAAARGETVPATPAEHAAKAIHDHPADLRRAWLAALEEQGLTLVEYVEVLGLVARLRALDTVLFGVGAATRPLPEPVDGEPSRRIVDEASINGGWVPTVGPAWPPTVLSSVPTESEAMEDVHSVLYLAASADAEGSTMGNMRVVRDGLSRSQMEFVAARASLINDCFY